MDVNHVWCDLKPGAGDTEFADNVRGFLAHRKDAGQIADFRLTRRKLGLGPAELGEFHITIEADDLAQLDRAFAVVSGRAEPEEGLHFSVNSMVSKATFALYRDFLDPGRRRGEERF